MLVIFVGRRLELSVHCEVAAAVSQPPVNLGTGRDLRRHAPLLVFNYTAWVIQCNFSLAVISVNETVI